MQYITFGAKNQMRYFLYENALLLQGFRLTSNHKKLTKFSHYMPENHVNQYVVHHIWMTYLLHHKNMSNHTVYRMDLGLVVVVPKY